MSGEAEIKKWIVDHGLINPKDTVQENYDRIAAIFDKDNRLPLDDILKDEKSKLEEFINGELFVEKPIEPPVVNFIDSFVGKLTDFLQSFLGIQEETEPTGFITVIGYSYIRRTKTGTRVINVPTHQRRKRK